MNSSAGDATIRNMPERWRHWLQCLIARALDLAPIAIIIWLLLAGILAFLGTRGGALSTLIGSASYGEWLRLLGFYIAILSLPPIFISAGPIPQIDDLAVDCALRQAEIIGDRDASPTTESPQ